MSWGVNEWFFASPNRTLQPFTWDDPPTTAPPEFGAVEIMSLLPEEKYSGVVPLTIQIDPSLSVPSAVTITLGEFTRNCQRVGASNIWQAVDQSGNPFPWDTTKRLTDPTVVSPSNHMVWVQARATIDGAPYSTPLFGVYTNNYDYGNLADRGWEASLAWSAVYTDKTAWLASHTAAPAGAAYATVVNDPVLGAGRKVVKVTLPDSAKNDADQPTNSPRFQSQQPTTPSNKGFYEGQEYCIGFAIYVPTVNSSATGSGGFPSVNASRPGETNQHIAIFQHYGPQASNYDYPSGRGAALIIDANRHSLTEPADRFHIEANQLNGGDPGFVVDFPYNRGGWTDIVLKVRASCDITKGWIEVYLNQGGSETVQPVPFWDGRFRLPRVTLWPNTSTPPVPPTYVGSDLVVGGSRRHRSDMQIYRSPTAYQEATLYHFGHKVGQTVESVDPRSYG